MDSTLNTIISSERYDDEDIKVMDDKLNQLKQINLFNDPDIEKIINGACDSITSISSWRKEDVDSVDIESQLSSIVRSLKTEVDEIEKNPEKMLVIKRAIELSDNKLNKEIETPEIAVLGRTINITGDEDDSE